MSWWYLLTIVYPTGAVLTWYSLITPFANAIRNRNKYRNTDALPNVDQYLGAACLSLLAAIVWPLTIMVAHRVYRDTKQDALIKEQRRRIRELEDLDREIAQGIR